MTLINSPITNVVLLVSLGVLIFIMIFCFAKRQISRYALKSSKSAHDSIGHHAPTSLLLEIERRLNRVKDICIEPVLIPAGLHEDLKRRAKLDPGFYFYRMYTLDSVNHLYKEIRRCNPGAVKKVGVPLRVFLFEQRQVGCLEGIRLEVIERFCSSYDHARHDPKPFTKNDYKEFQGILKLLLHYMHNKFTTLRQQQQVTPSPTDPSDRSTSSQQKLINTTTAASPVTKRASITPATTTFPSSKRTWITPALIKSPFQSLNRAFSDEDRYRPATESSKQASRPSTLRTTVESLKKTIGRKTTPNSAGSSSNKHFNKSNNRSNDNANESCELDSLSSLRGFAADDDDDDDTECGEDVAECNSTADDILPCSSSSRGRALMDECTMSYGRLDDTEFEGVVNEGVAGEEGEVRRVSIENARKIS